MRTGRGAFFCGGALVLLLGLVGCAHYQAKPVSLQETARAFDSRSLTNEELRAFLSAQRKSSEPLDTWDFENLTLAAFYYHPSLELARAQWQAASSGIKTAQARPNPTVGFTPGYNLDAVSPTTPWIPGATVDIPVETAGKRSKRIAQANLLAESARQNVMAAAWQVRSNLRIALIELWSAKRRIHLIGREITNQAALFQLLEQRLNAGAIAGSELLPFQVSRVRLQAEAAAARAATVQAKSHLAEAIGIPAAALQDVKLADEIAGDAREDFPSDPAELRASALQHRSDLLSMLAKYEASQAALRLEIAKQYPDVRLGSGYQWDQGESKWNLSLSMEVPLFNRNQGPIAEAESRRAEVAAQLLELQSRVIAEIDRTLASFRAAQEENSRAQEGLAALDEQSKLTQQRLAAGGADQVELQTIRIEEDAAILAALDSEVRVLTAKAQLESALQTPFSSLSAALTNPASHP